MPRTWATDVEQQAPKLTKQRQGRLRKLDRFDGGGNEASQLLHLANKTEAKMHQEHKVKALSRLFENLLSQQYPWIELSRSKPRMLATV